jgi:hypothetical protein
MRTLLWRIQFALQFSESVSIKFSHAFQSSKAALHNIDYDLSCSPIDAALEEADLWAQAKDSDDS